MTAASDKFEKQIQRIHELLVDPDSEVTWNDHIPDPDNPTQNRQIDITIKTNETLTIVECRIHKKAQDVKWIEEIIGRRVSLDADAAIAVSASGFTSGAIKKAEAYGIILRDIQTLTEEEISHWGKSTHVWLTFFEYHDVSIQFQIEAETGKAPTIEEIVKELNETNTLYRIFEMASDAINQKNPKGAPCEFSGHFKVENIDVCNHKVKDIIFSCDVKSIKKELNIPSVVAYDAPEIPKSSREVLVEKVDIGDFEITQSNNRVYIAVDLSPIECPPNCQFKYISFDFNREVTTEALELLALPKMHIPINNIKLGVAIYETNSV